MDSELHEERVGRYRLLERIAVGNAAEVYLAHDPEGASKRDIVVVKRLLSERRHDRQAIGAFRDETRLLRALSHPNIVELLDSGEADGLPYLVLEHVWGVTLDSLAWLCTEKRKPFPVSAGLSIGAQVAAALAYAHQHRDEHGRASPIIHRDVTSGNVMVSETGQVKLLDFGIAKAEDRSGWTRAGQIKGTLFYISPEQTRGGQIGPATDVYQLGILLYRILVGREPIKTGSVSQVLRAIVNGELIAPSKNMPGFPRLIEQVLLRACAREPVDRFATAGELGQELRELLGTRADQGRALLERMMRHVAAGHLDKQRQVIERRLHGLKVDERLAQHCHRDTERGEPPTVDVDLARLLRKVDLLTAASGESSDDLQATLDRLMHEADLSFALSDVGDSDPGPVMLPISDSDEFALETLVDPALPAALDASSADTLPPPGSAASPAYVGSPQTIRTEEFESISSTLSSFESVPDTMPCQPRVSAVTKKRTAPPSPREGSQSSASERERGEGTGDGGSSRSS